MKTRWSTQDTYQDEDLVVLHTMTQEEVVIEVLSTFFFLVFQIWDMEQAWSFDR